MRNVLIQCGIVILGSALWCSCKDGESGPQPGEPGQACKSDGSCNSGLTCSDNVCVSVCEGITCGGFGTCVAENGGPACQCDNDAAPTGAALECAPLAPAGTCEFEFACIEPFRTRCETVGSQALCVCDTGYHANDIGNCIPDPGGLCDPNPCSDEPRTYCRIVEDANSDGVYTTQCDCSIGTYEDWRGICQPTDACHPHQCFEPHKNVCTMTSVTEYECNCNPAYTWNEGSQTCQADDPNHACDDFHFEGDQYEPDECAPLANSIALDEERQMSAEPKWDKDWLKFTAEAGHIYTVEVRNISIYFTSITLMSTDGLQQLQYKQCDHSTHSLDYEIPAAGDYYVVIEGCSGYTGDYAVTIYDNGFDDHGNSTEFATDLTVGSTTNGTMGTVRDKDFFALRASARHAYDFVVDLEPQVAVTYTLYDRDQLTEMYATDCSSDDFHIPFKLATSSNYYVRLAACYGYTGDYTLTVNDLGEDDHGDDQASASALTAAAAGTGQITAINDVDFFSFNVDVNSATIYGFDFTRTSINGAFFAIVNQVGAEMYRSGCSAAHDPADFRYKFDESGTYYIMVKGCSNDDLGSYSISYQSFPGITDDHLDVVEEASQIDSLAEVTSSPITGEIQAFNDVDMFQVTLDDGVTYSIEFTLDTLGEGNTMLGTGNNPATGCITSSPQSISYTNDQGQNLKTIIEVRGCQGAMGTYTLTATAQ